MAGGPERVRQPLLLGIVGWKLLGRRRYRGQVSLWIFLLYAITRFAIEAFRGDGLRGVWVGGLSTSQLVSIPVALSAGFLLWKFRGRRDAEPEERTAE